MVNILTFYLTKFKSTPNKSAAGLSSFHQRKDFYQQHKNIKKSEKWKERKQKHEQQM